MFRSGLEFTCPLVWHEIRPRRRRSAGVVSQTPHQSAAARTASRERLFGTRPSADRASLMIVFGTPLGGLHHVGGDPIALHRVWMREAHCPGAVRSRRCGQHLQMNRFGQRRQLLARRSLRAGVALRDHQRVFHDRGEFESGRDAVVANVVVLLAENDRCRNREPAAALRGLASGSSPPSSSCSLRRTKSSLQMKISPRTSSRLNRGPIFQRQHAHGADVRGDVVAADPSPRQGGKLHLSVPQFKFGRHFYFGWPAPSTLIRSTTRCDARSSRV